MRVTTLLLFTAALLFVCAAQKPKDRYSWKVIDFVWPNSGRRSRALQTREYIPENNLPLGLEVWRDRLFITVPRRKAGVPVTLGYISINATMSQQSPLLMPYPDWNTNRLSNSTAPPVHITSTYRVRADACDRLWIIDTGLADPGSGTVERITAPQIVIVDLRTNKVIRNYYMKDADVRTDSFLANIAIDVTSKTCNDAFAYIPDLGAFGMVVYNYRNNSSFRISHHYFYFDPLNGDYNIAGINFQWTDGAFAVALSEVKPDGFRTLYFHSLSSTNEFAVSTKILKNETIANSRFHDYKLVGTRGLYGQSTGSVYHEKTGVLFFMEIQRHQLTCWNTRKGLLMPENLGVIAQSNDPSFIYPSDIRIDSRDNLWFINNNLPVYLYRKVNTNMHNYFIFTMPVDTAIRGTVCQPAVHVPQTSYGGELRSFFYSFV